MEWSFTVAVIVMIQRVTEALWVIDLSGGCRASCSDEMFGFDSRPEETYCVGSLVDALKRLKMCF